MLFFSFLKFKVLTFITCLLIFRHQIINQEICLLITNEKYSYLCLKNSENVNVKQIEFSLGAYYHQYCSLSNTDLPTASFFYKTTKQRFFILAQLRIEWAENIYSF